MPVIIMSSLTTQGSTKALEALQAGAVEVMAKPGSSYAVAEDSHRLADKIKAVAKARMRAPALPSAAPPSVAAPPPPLSHATNVAVPPRGPVAPVAGGRRYPARTLVLIGASTGGTEAIRTVLTALPADVPPILVVQHIPAHFSLAFANRLNELCQFEVREARHGDRTQPGLALVAPGGFHLVPRWMGSHYSVSLSDGPPLHHQRPAVDVLFDSAVRAGAGPHSLALLLTGMGSDGATGMLSLRNAGAATAAQNEESCVVFGMPREAIRLGAAQRVLPLDQMARCIDQYADSVALGRS